MKISLLINMKMLTIVGIFIFISRENFVLSCWAWKMYCNLGQGLISLRYFSYNLNKSVLLPSCLKTAGWVANSVDPDQPHFAASDQDQHYLLRPVCLDTLGKLSKIYFPSQNVLMFFLFHHDSSGYTPEHMRHKLEDKCLVKIQISLLIHAV